MGYGEFFESLFALWSIGGTNNGGLEARMREGEEDGERRGSGRRATLNQECVFASVATATDMISTHKGKRTPAKTDGGARQTAQVSVAVKQCILGEEGG